MGTAEDKGAAGRPAVFFNPLDPWELLAAYTTSGLARTIIDEVPKRATRRGWDVDGLDLGEDKVLQVPARFREGSNMGRLYGGAAGILVTEDDVPAGFARQPWKWLQQPLDLERVQRVLGLIVFDTFEAQIYELERSPLAGTAYRRPRLWSVGAEGFEQLHSIVHASRVLQFRGRHRTPTEQHARGFWRTSGRSQYWQQDDSTLQAVWDEIARLTMTMQGGATLAQELSVGVFHIQGMRGAVVGDQSEEFAERMALTSKLKAVHRSVYLDKEDNYTAVPSNVAGFKDLSEAAKSMLAAVTRIPEVILFGRAPEGMNTDGSSGWQGFYQTVSDWQEEEMRPLLERFYQVLFASHASRSTGDPHNVQLTFNPLDEPSEKELAETRLIMAQADAVNIQAGIYDAMDVAEHRYGKDGFSVDIGPIDLREVQERQELDEAREALAAIRGASNPGAPAQGGQGGSGGGAE